MMQLNGMMMQLNYEKSADVSALIAQIKLLAFVLYYLTNRLLQRPHRCIHMLLGKLEARPK